MRMDSRGKEKFTNPVYSSSQFTSPHGPTPPPSEGRGYTFWASPKSSIRPSAPSSLVACGGGCEERRAGRRRTGQVGAPLFLVLKTQMVLLGIH